MKRKTESSPTQQQLEDELKRLKQQLETEFAELVNSTKENSNLADYTVMLMEQLSITNNTILSWWSFEKKVWGSVLKNGCDRQTYFEAQMVGNHYINYADHSEVIYSDMFESLIQSSYNKIWRKSWIISHGEWKKLCLHGSKSNE